MANLISLIGAVDNLNEPQPVLNRKEAIIGIVITFHLFTWICVLLRLYTRFFMVRSAGWDDVFVILSAASTTVGGTAICIMAYTGMGKHLVLLSDQEISGYLRAFWIANATYPSSTTFIKLALLLQYMRVYDQASILRVVAKCVAVFTALWGLAYTILAWFPTVPISGYWNLTEPALRYAYGSQLASVFVATYESHAAVNMLLDAVVLAIAVPLFFQSGMRKKSYWGLLGLVFLGGIVNMLSIWRLQSIVETQATTSPTFDPTWYGPTPIILSSIEVTLATICASLPVFWPMLQKNVGQIFVTHEVKITREHRQMTDDDDIELNRHNSEAADSTVSGGVLSGHGRTFSGLSTKYFGRDSTSTQQPHRDHGNNQPSAHVEVVTGKGADGYY